MKTKIIFLVTIIFHSCCSTNISIVGKYASKTNPSCFQFKDDSTYIYEFRKVHVYEYSTGYWRKNNKNTIELNSGIKSTVIPLKVIENGSTVINKSVLSVTLNINGGLQLTDYKCEIYVNDILYCVKRCDSLSAVPINSIVNSFYLKLIKEPLVVTSTLISLPLITERYEPKKNGHVNLKIEASLDDSFFSYRPFNKELVKVKKDGIKYYYNKQWQKIPKVSNEANIFIHY